jgi:glucosamine-6-phosphate deaminase
MEVIIQTTIGEACKLAAEIIAQTIRTKPTAVLGLATGKTMEPLYEELVRHHQDSQLDFHRVTTFNLDEYVGLAPEHPSSYHTFMQQKLFAHVNIPSSQTFFPDGLADDIPASCADFEEKIKRANGIDLQLVGIGADGHIGFNEPISSLSSRTRIKTLTKESVSESRRWWRPEENIVPHVLTMGIGTILEARRCLLLAFGEKKRFAVAAAVEGPVTAMVPASALQMHPYTTVIIDKPAAQELKLTDYYRFAYENKPSWQRY